MKDFRTYVAEAKKVNEYKLRLALNELTDSANVGKIKQYLEQYGLHGFKNPTKTIIQKSPMGLKTENACLLYTSPSPRDATLARMPSEA